MHGYFYGYFAGLPALSFLQWALLAFAAMTSGIAKTGVPGFGIIGVALFAAILPPKFAVGAVLLILICADVLAMLTYRRQGDLTQIGRLLPWALVGVVLGTLALGRLDEALVRRLIGVILLLMVLLSFSRQRQGGKNEPVNLPAWATGLTGITAGFTTMVANAAGPVMTLYLISMHLPKMVFLGTAAWFFFVVNWLKVPFGFYAGTITAESLRFAVLLFPAAIAGGLAGRLLAQRLNQQIFETLALLLTVPAALWMLLR